MDECTWSWQPQLRLRVQAAVCPAKTPSCCRFVFEPPRKPLFEQLATSECIIYPRRPPLFFSRHRQAKDNTVCVCMWGWGVGGGVGPSASAPSIQYPALNLDWQLVSYMISHMFQCHSPKSSHFLRGSFPGAGEDHEDPTHRGSPDAARSPEREKLCTKAPSM